jgi:hypothetical protein
MWAYVFEGIGQSMVLDEVVFRGRCNLAAEFGLKHGRRSDVEDHKHTISRQKETF